MIWEVKALPSAGWNARESSVMWARVWNTMIVDVIGSAGFIRFYLALGIVVGVLGHTQNLCKGLRSSECGCANQLKERKKVIAYKGFTLVQDYGRPHR